MVLLFFYVYAGVELKSDPLQTSVKSSVFKVLKVVVTNLTGC